MALLLTIGLLGAGCAVIAEKTNMLSESDIKAETANILGVSASDLTISNKRTQGTNTYYSIKTKDGKEFNCMINGGNFATMGATNPPTCAKKGEALKTGPGA
jgi:hypothetical protein